MIIIDVDLTCPGSPIVVCGTRVGEVSTESGSYRVVADEERPDANIVTRSLPLSVLTSLSNLDAPWKFTILNIFLPVVDTNLSRFGLSFGPRTVPKSLI